MVNINPFNTGNPMDWKDAAITATIVAFVIWIMSFFANAEYILIAEAPSEWAFEAFKSYIVQWAGSFIGLAGLEEVVKRGQTKE